MIDARVALLIRGPGIRVPTSAPKSHEESQDSSWDFSVLRRLHIFAHFLHIGGKGVHPLHRLQEARLERLLHLVKRASCKQEPREFAPLLRSHLAHQVEKAGYGQASASGRSSSLLWPVVLIWTVSSLPSNSALAISIAVTPFSFLRFSSVMTNSCMQPVSKAMS